MLLLDKLLKIKAGRGLEKIVQHAQDMDALARRVRAELGSPLAEQVAAVNVRDDGELVIVCRSQAFAARIRFEGDRLLRAARDHGARVTRCRVKVGG